MSLPEARVLSYTEEFIPLWDVCVHFLEILPQCASRNKNSPDSLEPGLFCFY